MAATMREGARLPVLESRRARPMRPPPVPAGFDPTAPLGDAQGRLYTYARLSVTDRCDMACVYCMPDGGEAEHGVRRELLSDDELARLAGVLAGLGVTRLRLTGGEPLVRRGVPALAGRLREAGAREVVLTTNASMLSAHAEALAAAGVSTVNVSIDSLEPARFASITRGGSLARTLEGIHAARAAGMKVKTNTVVLGGVNDGELGAIVDWAWAQGFVPRFVELMPIGEGARLPSERFVSASRIVAALGDRIAKAHAQADAGAGPARYLDARDGSGRRVGLITAVSDEFCGTCNRIRITSHGELRGCLADRAAVSLRDAMRVGASDRELAWAIAWAVGGKGLGHAFGEPAAHEHERVGMSLIGG